MRTVPKDIADKLIKNIQTKGTAANPSTEAWISRPTTALTEDTFLEKQTVLEGTFTDVSIAVCHPYFGATNTKLNMAYISNGKANVMVSICRANMQSHEWYETGFSEDASAVALAYDGKMPKNTAGKYEFVTETQPWVFWISAGVLYARKLGETETVILAEANCTDVTAIRAMWSDVPGFDFGLCVFFILSGVLYYRQLIDGVWYNAELIPSAVLPIGKTWAQVGAQRTWDYRVALQIVDTNGSIYEVFTQFGGMGSKNAEHLKIKNVSVFGQTTKVDYLDSKEIEHVEISDVSVGSPYGGLYSIDTPTLIDAYNLPDLQNNYGKIAVFVFDIHINPNDVSAQSSQFCISDMYNIAYYPSVATLGPDGKTVTLNFTDFNNARGECTASYIPGTITTMAGAVLVSTSKNFVPTGLVPSEEPVPEILNLWNE